MKSWIPCWLCLLTVIALLGVQPSVAQDSFGNDLQQGQPPSQGVLRQRGDPQQQGSQQQSDPRQRSDPSAQQKTPQQGRPYPQQANVPQQTGSGMPPGQPNFAAVAQIEAQSFGVVPVAQLHSGGMHGPTPTEIPGGRVITTQALYSSMQQQQRGIVIFDVLGGTEGLPGAQNAVGAAQGGTFKDRTQQEFGNYLQQVTNGNKNLPLVFYCQSVQCWMSYNAALRAINMGYTQVHWYRGGIEAWKAAGLPTYPRM